MTITFRQGTIEGYGCSSASEGYGHSHYTNRNATPETSSDIQIGEVDLLQGLWVITNGLSPTVSRLIFPDAHYQLQINVYRLSIYGDDRNFEGAPVADPIVAKNVPNASCTAMVKIVKPLQAPVNRFRMTFPSIVNSSPKFA